MNLFLQLLNGNVDAKQIGALLLAWGMQIIVIVGIAFLESRSQAGSN